VADNTAGAPRVAAELEDDVPDGERVNHRRVARVMRLAGISRWLVHDAVTALDPSERISGQAIIRVRP